MLSTRRPRVLVVEDDAQLAQLYCTALALRGIHVIRAADGIAALRSVEQDRPDLVVLDLMLPTIDGWTVLREFAAQRPTRDIPVIVITGVDPTPELPHALMVLRKPCDAEHLARVVADHILALRGRLSASPA